MREILALNDHLPRHQQEVTRTVMASKTIQLFTLCVLALAVEQVVCVGVRVKSLKVKSRPNDYFGEIVTKLRYENEDCYISVRVPVKSQLDERFQVRGNLQFHGLPILRNQVNTLCEALDEKGFFKPIVDKIQPKNKFPGGCPIAAGNYTINNYVINMADYIPVGLIPSGKFEANFLIGQMGSSPIVSIAVTGSVIAERTGLTSFFNFFDTA
ncbi:hypothetical protein TKK_0012173 [Trichogramma kaykai]